MCKPPCCSPKDSSGIFGFVIAAAAVIITANALSAVAGLLITIAEIILLTTAALAVLALLTWTLIRRRRAVPASQPALPARPAAVISPGRDPGDDHDLAVRRFAEVIASYDDPAAVQALISRALHGSPRPIPRR
jgi:hypothetical protein